MHVILIEPLCIGATSQLHTTRSLIPVLVGLFISVIVAGWSVVAANPNTRSTTPAWVLFRGFNPSATIKASRAASAFGAQWQWLWFLAIDYGNPCLTLRSSRHSRFRRAFLNALRVFRRGCAWSLGRQRMRRTLKNLKRLWRTISGMSGLLWQFWPHCFSTSGC